MTRTRRLRVPAALAIVVIAGCRDGKQPAIDARPADTVAVRDAPPDASIGDAPGDTPLG